MSKGSSGVSVTSAGNAPPPASKRSTLWSPGSSATERDDGRGAGSDGAIAAPSRSMADRVVPILALTLGVALACVSAWWVHHTERAQRLSQLEQDGAARIMDLAREVELTVEGVRPLALLFESSEEVTRSEFQRFAQEILRRQPLLESLAWLPRLEDVDRDAFEASRRAEGVADFEIRDRAGYRRFARAPRRDAYYPVDFIEPWEENPLIVGSDVGIGAPSEHSALTRSLRSRDLTVSALFDLDWLPDRRRAVHVYAPVFDQSGKAPEANTEQRAIGAVLGTFDIERLLRGAAKDDAAPGIILRAYDLVEQASQQQAAGVGMSDSGPEIPDDAVVIRSQEIQVGGRPWRVEALTIAHEIPLWRSTAVGVLATGILASMLLAGFLAGRIGRLNAHRQLEDRTRDLRRTNDSLTASQRRVQTLFGAAIDPLWDWDIVRNSTMHSPSWNRMIGLDPAQTLTPESEWSNLVHPDDLPLVLAQLDRCIQGQTERYEATYRLRTVNGEWIRVLSRGSVVERNEAGRATRMIGNLTDVSAIEDAREAAQASERRLSESEQRLRAIFDRAAVGIAQLDLSGRIMIVNQFFGDMVGDAPDELANRMFADVVQLEHEPAKVDLLRRLLAGEIDACDLQHCFARRGDGRDVWADINLSLVRNDSERPVHVIGVISDITGRKAAEADATRWYERHSLAMEAVAGIVYDWDMRTDQVTRSHGTMTVLGFDPEELGSSASAWRDRIHPADLAAWSEGFRTSMAEGSSFSNEYRVIHRNGSVVWVLDRGIIVRDQAGRPVRIVGCTMDISMRRAAEESLRISEERHRVFVQQPNVIMWEFDAESSAISYLSGAPGALLGYTIDEWKQPGFWAAHIHPDDAPGAVDFCRARTANLEDHSFEYRFITADGRTVWLWDIATVYINERGGVSLRGIMIDVTKDRLAEKAIRESEATNRALLQAVPDHMFRMDREGRYLGYHSADESHILISEPDFLGRTVDEVLTREQAATCMHHLRALFETRQSQTYEFQTEHGDSTYHHEVRMVLCGTDEALLLVRDVSMRKQAELALRESEERYRDLVELMPDAIVVHRHGRILFVNEVACRLIGFGSPEELLGHNVFDYVHPNDRQTAVNRSQNAMNTGSVLPVKQGRIINRAGEERDVETTVSRVSYAGTHAVLTVVRDITERVRAAELLRQAQSRLAAVLEHMPDVALYDCLPESYFMSENVQRVLGYEAGVFLADRGFYPTLIHPEDSPIVEERIRELRTQRGGGTLVLQYRVRRPDGAYIWVEDRMVARRTPDGGSRRTGVLIDVTERKKVEQSLRTMMTELDHRVKNNLAAVITLAEQSLRTTSNMQEFHNVFVSRVRALARVHQALAQTHWQEVNLRSMIEQSLAPFQGASGGRVIIEGKDFILPGRIGSPLALTLHELATNAVKYGALSSLDGHLRVSWDLVDAGAATPVLKLRWKELDGPPVSAPTRRGFGRDLIEGGLAHEIGARVSLAFPEGGVECDITIPIPEAAVSPESRPGADGPGSVWDPSRDRPAQRPEIGDLVR